ncbi:MAG: isopentenyl-diphosphate Delta-isomerase [Actinomycetales bacterium]
MPSSTVADEVVLLDQAARPVGTHPRALVHDEHTPLHLAFSVHLADESGLVLLTRRALGKRTWPGVWTNSCCGHPLPGEPLAEAIVRRVGEELGCVPTDLQELLPNFRYRAVDASGIVENEVCPVYRGRVRRADVQPDPAEVVEHCWVPHSAAVAIAQSAAPLLSPWSVMQWREIGEDDPWQAG